MSQRPTDTFSESMGDLKADSDSRQGAAEPGLVMLFAVGQPYCTVLPVGPVPLEVGRGVGVLQDHRDSLMSRRHARVAYREGCFEVTDLGGRNGSAIDGIPFTGTKIVSEQSVIRLGHSLFMCCRDLRPFRGFGVRSVDGRIEGPTLQQVSRTVAQLAQASRTLFLCGESGSGKEAQAQTFHRAAPQNSGPLIAINCAAIPEGVAERLLFGARKGSFSGATSDGEGYIEAANGGTLFLDEVAELSDNVQSKLLRVIETGELLPLGATRVRKVQFRVCSATYKDLRALAQAGRFRTDLYFRIGIPEVNLPPLRERREEIPWLIHQAVAGAASELSVSALLVEACLLRPWPGNIRELLAEISTAALAARAARSALLLTEHLNPKAGTSMAAPAVLPSASPKLTEAPPPAFSSSWSPSMSVTSSSVEGQNQAPTRAEILATLVAAKGNVSTAARTVGIQRTQFRRLLARYQIDVGKVRDLGAGATGKRG